MGAASWHSDGVPTPVLTSLHQFQDGVTLVWVLSSFASVVGRRVARAPPPPRQPRRRWEALIWTPLEEQAAGLGQPLWAGESGRRRWAQSGSARAPPYWQAPAE